MPADLGRLAMGFVHMVHEGLIRQLNLDLAGRAATRARPPLNDQ